MQKPTLMYCLLLFYSLHCTQSHSVRLKLKLLIDWLIDGYLVNHNQTLVTYVECDFKLIDFNVMCIQYGQPAYVLSILVQVSSTYSYSQTIDNVLLITTIYAAGRFPDTTFSRHDVFPTGLFPDGAFPRYTFNELIWNLQLMMLSHHPGSCYFNFILAL